jgi:predicted HAD superfamily Cof-like phosphohydrolase
MKKQIEKVREFHNAFGISNAEKPTVIDLNESLLRYTLLREENEEYLEACKNGNLTEIADALGDILYITFGTLLKHGLGHKIEEIFDEIHRSNMSKLDDNGKPIYREDGKVLKSKNYFKPDIESILKC